MAPPKSASGRNQKSASEGGKAKDNHHADNSKAEHPLQAVVVADAAELRFRPLTLERPRCLLPLANIPMIEYTLEFLAVAGVQEIFVFCKSHADQIRAYLATSKWSKPRPSQLRIQIILAPSALGVGDVLRELDAKSLIHTDFILVSGSCVANMKLDRVLEEHRNRKLENKDSIMTMVMKRASVYHRTRAVGEASLLALDPRDAACVHYELVPEYPAKRYLHLDAAKFKRRPVLQLHHDLLDCQIDICSVEVPALFTENFDYQDIRSDFVRGILESDLLGKSIHVHIIGDEYAARVRSTQTYDAIAKDIIARWTFPMVPDSNVHEGDTYQYSRGNIYKENHVVLARSCVLEENVVIGTGTEIGENTIVRHSTIGRNCRIGPNVIIDNAYIWDNVTVEAGCTVSRSILADGCCIKPNVGITRGCVISFGVVVGPDVALPPFTKLTRTVPEVDTHFGPHQPPQLANTALVGAEGVAYVWCDEWDEEAEEFEDPRNRHVNHIGYARVRVAVDDGVEDDLSSMCASSTDGADDDSDSDVDYDAASDAPSGGGGGGSFVGSGFSGRTIDINAAPPPKISYMAEAEETIRRSVAQDHNIEDAVLEMNGLKMAGNITFHDLRVASVRVLVSFVQMDLSTKASVKKVFNKWGKLLARFIDNAGQSDEDQMDLLNITLETCRCEASGKLALEIVMNYYENDVVAPETISLWYERRSKWIVDDFTSKAAINIGRFVEWMNQSEEEEDDSSEDGSASESSQK